MRLFREQLWSDILQGRHLAHWREEGALHQISGMKNQKWKTKLFYNLKFNCVITGDKEMAEAWRPAECHRVHAWTKGWGGSKGLDWVSRVQKVFFTVSWKLCKSCPEVRLLYWYIFQSEIHKYLIVFFKRVGFEDVVVHDITDDLQESLKNESICMEMKKEDFIQVCAVL